MVTARSAILLKITLDFFFILLVVCLYFAPIFIYDTDFNIGPIYIQYNFHKDGLSTSVKCIYKDFNDYLCTSELEDTKTLCSD